MRTYFRASALQFEFQQRVYAIPYIIYCGLNIMLLLPFVDIFEGMFIFQFRIWNRGIMSSISQRLCNVNDDVGRTCYRRNIKPHCIHICKVNSTILCEIRYQKFTGVKPCLKYSNGNRNELQNLSINVMKTISIYICIFSNQTHDVIVNSWIRGFIR